LLKYHCSKQSNKLYPSAANRKERRAHPFTSQEKKKLLPKFALGKEG